MRYRWFFNHGEIHEPALYFFQSDTGVPASTSVGLNPGLGTVQQLFRS
jgi:hypothetical protein